MRIAVVSSPRSGSSWIRTALAQSLGWADFAFHHYEDSPDPLPEACFLQIHWNRESAFTSWLEKNEFRVLTVARHPLDVLLSAVRYGERAQDVRRWLDGNTGLPVRLGPGGSASDEFISYALSDGAAKLLSVTPDWWGLPDTIRIRYEDAVRDPISVLGSTTVDLGGSTLGLDAALDLVSIMKMRQTPNRHGWRGEPGHWKELVTPDVAAKIFFSHEKVFRTLGYTVFEPYYLSPVTAAANWRRIA